MNGTWLKEKRRDAEQNMQISFTEDQRGGTTQFQARVEESFSSGDGHGDFCLTAYGCSQDEAHQNLKQLALRMVREMDAIKLT